MIISVSQSQSFQIQYNYANVIRIVKVFLGLPLRKQYIRLTDKVDYTFHFPYLAMKWPQFLPALFSSIPHALLEVCGIHEPLVWQWPSGPETVEANTYLRIEKWGVLENIFHRVTMEMLAYGMCQPPCQKHEFRMNRWHVSEARNFSSFSHTFSGVYSYCFMLVFVSSNIWVAVMFENITPH